ncbi:MAG: response regulator [Cyclobacteriaceae bacterium]|nr:response regulator [Cyclobacteriaceae bacterium]
MINVIIIDDEPLARSIVKEYLMAYPDMQVVQECGDGFEGVKAIAARQPDLIFLDIQMPKINGFEMLELVENQPSVIFTTAFDEYAMQAFETNAIDYLLKPFNQDRFDKAILKWKSRITKNEGLAPAFSESLRQPEERNRVVVKVGNAIKILPVHDIHYIEAYDDYVKIHTQDGYHLKKKTMNFFEKALDNNQFVRVHRSYIISLAQLTKIEMKEKESYVAKMKDGSVIPMSKTGYSRLKEVLGL